MDEKTYKDSIKNAEKRGILKGELSFVIIITIYSFAMWIGEVTGFTGFGLLDPYISDAKLYGIMTFLLFIGLLSHTYRIRKIKIE